MFAQGKKLHKARACGQLLNFEKLTKYDNTVFTKQEVSVSVDITAVMVVISDIVVHSSCLLFTPVFFS